MRSLSVRARISPVAAMNMRRAFLTSLLLALPPGVLSANTIVEFDRIGPTEPATAAWVEDKNGLPMFDDIAAAPSVHRRSGIHWIQSTDATAHELRIITFNPFGPAFDPNHANINLHLWLGFDSFAADPKTGDLVIPYIQINHIATPFSDTGPNGVEYPTWEIRFLLSELASPLQLQAGQEYVLAPVAIENELYLQFSNPPQFTGLRDVYGQVLWDDIDIPANFIDTITGVSLKQFGAFLSVTPLLPGDYDGDGDVDGADYDKWRAAFGSDNALADGNDDGTVNAADYVVWRDHYGEVASLPAATTVPEPGTRLLLLALASLVGLYRGANRAIQPRG